MRTYLFVRSLKQFIGGVKLLNMPEFDSLLTDCFLEMLKYELDNYDVMLENLKPNEQSKVKFSN